MSAEHEESSVSDWIESLREGDPSAADKLWRRYHAALVTEARARIAKAGRFATGVEADDVLQSVFTNVFQRISEGEYPEIDRRGLWSLLIVATERRVYSRLRHANAVKRTPPGDMLTLGDDSLDLEDILVARATIATAHELVLVVAEFLGDLSTELHEIAKMRIEGYSIAEIAAKIDKSVATVERRLELIRKKLKRTMELDDKSDNGAMQ